jgi:Family of unknown function (DUF6069)
MAVGTSSSVGTSTRGNLWRAGGIALVLAVLINELLRIGSVAALGIDPGFLPLTAIGPVIMFTAVGVIGATVVYWLLTRFTKSPDRIFTTIAWVGLVLSFIPNILTGLSPQSAPFPGVTWVAIGVLMVMHIPPALLSIYMLTRR